MNNFQKQLKVNFWKRLTERTLRPETNGGFPEGTPGDSPAEILEGFKQEILEIF